MDITTTNYPGGMPTTNFTTTFMSPQQNWQIPQNQQTFQQQPSIHTPLFNIPHMQDYHNPLIYGQSQVQMPMNFLPNSLSPPPFTPNMMHLQNGMSNQQIPPNYIMPIRQQIPGGVVYNFAPGQQFSSPCGQL